MEQGFVDFIKTHKKDTIAYILLIIGIIISFFIRFWGDIIIGGVAGFYFCDDILHAVRNIQQTIVERGIIKIVVLGGVTIALFLAAPGLFVGAALVVLVMRFLHLSSV